MRRLRTQVGIVGAGPAGLVLAHALGRAGVDCLVLERHSRARVEARARAGLLEERTVSHLRRHGLAGRLLAEGTRHGWCEFLCAGHRLRMDYAALGGAEHWVYPQHWLVRDLIAALETAGRPPRFGVPVLAVEERRRIRCDGLELDCEYVIGCDGARGVTRRALPAGLRRETTRRYPYDWVAVLAEVARPVGGVLYALHERGFAGMMPRTPAIGRFYLQCAAGDTPADWPGPRVRAELALRLPLAEVGLGALQEVRILRMHSRITRPFRHGRLVLAGDAAHVLTPSGAKGMNLAIADATDLADSLLHGGLDGYGRRRLAAVRRAQDFSERLLRLLHRPPHEALPDLRLLTAPGPHATAFAREFTGTSEETDDAQWRA
ncbi:FAD-dependent monooxygenase [Streptomyces harbinensis]|uniref:FAD-dependent monooxygenase n=1 Tax=Streptomyces harbinensis TaxID=1176198 RepID=UPI003714CC73